MDAKILILLRRTSKTWVFKITQKGKMMNKLVRLLEIVKKQGWRCVIYKLMGGGGLIYKYRHINLVRDWLKLSEKDRKNLVCAWFARIRGERLNLDNPKTFNEKIQWLKLYDSTPMKTKLADKYLVREWVKDKIGEEYLVPLLGVYDKFDDIDFSKLPNRFVMKCNHGSGWNVIVPDKSKLNVVEAKIKIDQWMSENFAWLAGFELHYRDIKPKIVIEEFLDEISYNLYDYRFLCCNGTVEQIWVDVNSGTLEHKRTIYDRHWNELNIIVGWPRLAVDIPRPKNLGKLIELSETLAKDFCFVRVDFYNLAKHIYFGEMTFTPVSGGAMFSPKNEDLKLGEKITLPDRAYNVDTGEYYTLS